MTYNLTEISTLTGFPQTFQIDICGLKTKHLTPEGKEGHFLRLKDCSLRKLSYNYSAFLEGCTVEKVRVQGNLVLINCQKIGKARAGGNLFVIDSPHIETAYAGKTLRIVKYLIDYPHPKKMDAKGDVMIIEKSKHTRTFVDMIGKNLYLDRHVRTLILKRSVFENIYFENEGNGNNQVIIEEGSRVKGKVHLGTLVIN